MGGTSLKHPWNKAYSRSDPQVLQIGLHQPHVANHYAPCKAASLASRSVQGVQLASLDFRHPARVRCDAHRILLSSNSSPQTMLPRKMTPKDILVHQNLNEANVPEPCHYATLKALQNSKARKPQNYAPKPSNFSLQDPDTW